MEFRDVYALLFKRNSDLAIGEYVVLTYDENKNYVLKYGDITISEMIDIATDRQYEEVSNMIFNQCSINPNNIILVETTDNYKFQYSVGTVVGISKHYVLVMPDDRVQCMITSQHKKRLLVENEQTDLMVTGHAFDDDFIKDTLDLLDMKSDEKQGCSTNCVECYDAPQKEKEETQMFSEIGSSFGKLNSNQFRLSINGLAVKGKDNKYFTFNPETRELVEVSNGFFDDMKDLLFVMPATELEVGDIILHQNDKPYYITSIENGNVRGIDFEEAVENTLIPKTNVFGIKYYTKVFNCLGTNNILGTDLASNPMMAYALMGGKDFDLSKMMIFQAMTGKGKGISDLSENPIMLMALMSNENGGNGLSDFAKMQILSQISTKTKKKEKPAKEDKAN